MAMQNLMCKLLGILLLKYVNMTNCFLQIQADDLLPFFSFAKCFCSNSFATVMAYKDAIFYSLQVRQILLLVLYSPCTSMQFVIYSDITAWKNSFGNLSPISKSKFRKIELPNISTETSLPHVSLGGFQTQQNVFFS